MKTGTHPMQTRLRLFLDWGISFGDPYLLPEKAARTVAYASKQELEQTIRRCHHVQRSEMMAVGVLTDLLRMKKKAGQIKLTGFYWL